MSTVECATEGVSTWQKWLGALAMLSAAVSVVTFLVFFSVTAEFSKALVYGGDPLTMLYLSAPTISTVTGAASIPMAVVALWGSRRAMSTAISGFAIAVPLFGGLMFFAASFMLGQSPTANQDPPASMLLVSFWPSPPAVGMMGPLVAGAVVLWLRGVRGHRPAIAALVTGGMVTVYWIFDLLVMTVSSE